jgi:hypothetical protein
MSGVTDTLFGKDASTSYNNPYSSQVNTLLNSLTGITGKEANNVTTDINNGTNSINQAGTNYQSLMQGNLPSSYQQNFQTGIQSGVQGSTGQILSNAAKSGTLDSSTTSSALNGVSQDVASAAAKNYQSSLSEQAGLNAGLANTGQQQANLGLTQQSGLQSLLNSLLSQSYTTVDQGNAGLLSSALSGWASGGFKTGSK